MRAYHANTELLLTLAWLSSEARLYERLLDTDPKAAPRRSADTIPIIVDLLETELEQIHQQGVYSPIYTRLLRHRLAHIDWHVLVWTIRGEGGVTFYRESLPSSQDKDELERSETSLLWDLITSDEALLARLQRLSHHWNGQVELGAHALCEHFRLRTPLLLRTAECAFLMQELLRLSLERVEWHKLAARLLDIPLTDRPTPIPTILPRTGALRLATLKELVARAYADCGEGVSEGTFSPQLQALCRELADACYQVYGRIRELERRGEAYVE